MMGSVSKPPVSFGSRLGRVIRFFPLVCAWFPNKAAFRIHATRLITTNRNTSDDGAIAFYGKDDRTRLAEGTRCASCARFVNARVFLLRTQVRTGVNWVSTTRRVTIKRKPKHGRYEQACASPRRTALCRWQIGIYPLDDDWEKPLFASHPGTLFPTLLTWLIQVITIFPVVIGHKTLCPLPQALDFSTSQPLCDDLRTESENRKDRQFRQRECYLSRQPLHSRTHVRVTTCK